MSWPDYLRHEVRLAIRLTPRETEVCATLLMRRGERLTLQQIIEALYPDPEVAPEYETREAYLVLEGLQRKLGEHLDHVHGQGWMIA